jgi:hypothetical protein
VIVTQEAAESLQELGNLKEGSRRAGTQSMKKRVLLAGSEATLGMLAGPVHQNQELSEAKLQSPDGD